MTTTLVNAEAEYAKDKNLKKEDAAELIEWAHRQPHLPEINELQAIFFLQRWQYQKEIVKKAVDCFFSYKTLCSSIFLGQDPLQASLDILFFTVLPKKTPQGYNVILTKLLDLDVNKINVALILKYFDMVIMLSLYQQGYSKGALLIIDMKDIPYDIMPKIDPLLLKQFLYYFQNVSLLQMRGLHYLNMVSWREEYFSVVKPGLNKEILDALHIHDSIDGLTKYVPKECLPEDYGGLQESVSVLHEKTKEKLFANAALFDWENKQTVDESKRPGGPKTIEDILADVHSLKEGMTVTFLSADSAYAKDENLRKEDVNALVQWVSSQPHLPKINELQAIFFLQRWQYQKETAKAAIDLYFTYKTFFSEIFLGRNPFNKQLKYVADVFTFALLPQRTPEGYSIIFVKMIDFDADTFDFASEAKLVDMIIMMNLYQTMNFKGYLFVMDMIDLPYSFVAKIDPAIVKIMFHFWQGIFPWQLKGLHYFNIVPFINEFLAVIKPSMDKKLLNELHLHDTLESLTKFVPKDCLPQEYGGSQESIYVLHERTKVKLLANAALFEWEDTQRVDESKRQNKSSTIEDILAAVHPLEEEKTTLSSVVAAYAKDSSLREWDVKELVKWASTQPHLPEINELQAILFLQRWQYQKETAKAAIDLYFTYKTFFSELFLGRNPFSKQLKYVADVFTFAFLPQRTPEGYTIIFVKMIDFDVDTYDFSSQVKLVDMIIMTNLYQTMNFKGYLLIVDMIDYPQSFLETMDPAIVKIVFHFWQGILPWQLKGLHYFNIVPFMNEYLAVIKPTLDKKLLDELHLHDTLDSLTKFVPKDCLPQEYGGSQESIYVLHERTKDKLLANASLFEWEDTQRVDESKRQSKSKTFEDILAVVHPLGEAMATTLLSVDTAYAQDKNLKIEDVQAIEEWANNQPHLPAITELQAICFLQKWQYQKEAAETAIDEYFTYKTLFSDLFLGRNPLNSQVQQALGLFLLTVLPKKTPEGYSIIFSKMMVSDLEKFDLNALFKYVDMIMLLSLHQDGVSKGYVFVMDMQNLPQDFMKKIDPLTIKKFFYYVKEILPLHLEAIHYFNVPSFGNEIRALIRPSLSEELQEAFYLHDSVDGLVKYLDLQLLPEDYGGSLDSTSILHENIKSKLAANVAFFEWENQQVVDESKRPDQSKTMENVLEMLDFVENSK